MIFQKEQPIEYRECPYAQMASRVIFRALCDLVEPRYINNSRNPETEVNREIHSAVKFFESENPEESSFSLMCDLAYGDRADMLKEKIRTMSRHIFEHKIVLDYDLKRKVLSRGRRKPSPHSKNLRATCQVLSGKKPT